MASVAINSAKASSKTLNKRLWLSLLATSSAIGATYYYNNNNNRNQTPPPQKNTTKNWLFFGSTTPLAAYLAEKKDIHDFNEYQKIYNAIAKKIQEYDEYDEGIGFGPALVRLAWHQSGTYTKNNTGCPVHELKNEDGSFGVGGSFGGTMRHAKEAGDGANNGLQNARWLLAQVQQEFPWISHGDLYTLSGVVAVQEMGGPKIGWRSGRKDLDERFQQNGKLPDASRDADYVRGLFARMGFDDREVVSLLGAHALGSCHVVAPGLPKANGGEGPSTGPGSGFTGRWTAAPNYFTNDFYQLLLSEDWKVKQWNGPRQFVNKDDLMMLPTDMSLLDDPKYLKHVKTYASSEAKFFKDFSKDFQKLLELGIDFGGKKSWYFQTLDEQS